MLNIEESERERERVRNEFPSIINSNLQCIFFLNEEEAKLKSFFEEIVQIIQAKLKHNNTESLTLNAVEYTP